ncbi:MAG TPA: formylglycine-generating enzyme family protein [Verrucomicrobiae bacterium]|jgi:formylglycine-generating enzyme required for sulfatase activity|nr:formylglycine-generating enzyme family protein [Verrucomicrobiae bacterium]
MKYSKACGFALLLFLLAGYNYRAVAGPPTITNCAMVDSVPQLTIAAEVGTTNQVLSVTDLTQTNWTVLTNLVVTQSAYVFADTITSPGTQRFYRVADPNWPADSPPPGMALIPAGDFEMGNDFPNDYGEAQYEVPVHTVYISAFYMDKYEVSYALWTNVYAWGVSNGYSFDDPGAGKATNHPVQMVSWYDVVKWCNARSEMEGLMVSYYADSNMTQVYRTGDLAPYVDWYAGYRLPTESEWEKADRGGASAHRFPWSNTDTISHSQANYYADTNDYPYDVSPTQGYNPAFVDGVMPYTSPIGSFAPNGYGLYDTAGNVWEWCWDYAGNYSSDTETDPRGPTTGTTRVGRGGNWNYFAVDCRDSYRYGDPPTDTASNIGFRTARRVP